MGQNKGYGNQNLWLSQCEVDYCGQQTKWHEFDITPTPTHFLPIKYSAVENKYWTADVIKGGVSAINGLICLFPKDSGNKVFCTKL